MKRLSRHLKKTKAEKRPSPWKLTYDQFKPAQEGLREALCTLGNGYFGTRGAATESVASRIHYPGTYIAGVYNKTSTHIAGRTVVNEDIVNCPNWLLLTFKIGTGEWVAPATSIILSYYQELDMQRGVLTRTMRVQDQKGRRTTIKTERIVHMANPHRAAIRYVITPENYEGWIIVRSGLDGTVQNTGVARYRQLNSMHLVPETLGTFGHKGICLSVKTSQSAIEIAEAAKVRIRTQGKDVKPVSQILTKEKKQICQDFKIYVHKRQAYEIEKIVAIYTSKDRGNHNPVTEAVDSVKNAHGFAALLKSHEHAWEQLWEKSDIRVDGDPFTQMALRLHTFHLLQTASIHNMMIDAGLPARGLHGESYRGHIFWDEIFVLPFFDLHEPEISKALLLYRYRRLAQARKYARECGYKGAMFPWQSGATGEEETQVIHLNPLSEKWGPDHSRLQRHVSFAIAYNVWHHWEKTGDRRFLIRYGAEMFLSIAQFAASIARYNSRDDRYHTQGLMGPDEFHEKLPRNPQPGLKDNAYTNVLIVWTLVKSRYFIAILPERERDRLIKKLRLTTKELERWEEITRKMHIIVNDDDIISQFDGYFQLNDLNWDFYRRKYGHIQRMDRILKAEGKSPNEYKVSKQADVLMLLYLFPLPVVKQLLNRLGYRFDYDMLTENYTYYITRTSHGSTLSKVVHCYLAHLLGKSREASLLFSEILKSDIYDTQGGTTREGIHAGVMGGSIRIAMECFAGISAQDDRILINPDLPKTWRRVELRFLHGESWVSVATTRRYTTVFIHGTKTKSLKVPVEVQGTLHYLPSGRAYKICLESGMKRITRKGRLKMTQERILIIDGDISFTEMLKTRLIAMGYLVDGAGSGTEALNILQNEWVDLIILEVILQGGMNGFQLFREIKSNRNLSKIPIVMQSGKAGMKKVFQRLGAKRYFIKPYQIDTLLDEIKKLL